MVFPDRILKEIRVTEKATRISSDENQYIFEVFPDATRTQVKAAIEKVFNVKVSRVNIVNIKGKLKRNRTRQGVFSRTSTLKKAFVSLKDGYKIEIV